MKDTKAVVVLSGGQDSVTVLNLALSEHAEVHCVTFDYSQRHAIEILCASEIAANHDCKHVVVKVDSLRGLVSGALLNTVDDVNQRHSRLTELPASFVPARNAIFLTLAHAYAAEIGATMVYTGVCQTDYSGYPDCRQVFVTALQQALNLGYHTAIEIITPLMYMTKAETFRMAEALGCLPEIIHDTHTCYNGEHVRLHSWGYGCGDCAACQLRKRGFEEFLQAKENANVPVN